MFNKILITSADLNFDPIDSFSDVKEFIYIDFLNKDNLIIDSLKEYNFHFINKSSYLFFKDSNNRTLKYYTSIHIPNDISNNHILMNDLFTCDTILLTNIQSDNSIFSYLPNLFTIMIVKDSKYIYFN